MSGVALDAGFPPKTAARARRADGNASVPPPATRAVDVEEELREEAEADTKLLCGVP